MSAPEAPRRIRCAIYTRKSSEEGLEQEFNSLDAQREACEAYIASQRAEGWRAMREGYDDGGYSGGNLDRPGLQNLLEDTRLQDMHSSTRLRVDALTNRIDQLRQMTTKADQIKVETVELKRSAELDYEERREIWTQALTLFSDFSEHLYKTPGRLVINIDDTGYRFGVEIDGNQSEGISKMKIFCYDLMAICFARTRGLGIDFLVHDSTIFDGVDPRQRAHAIELADAMSRKYGFQYILTMNTDMLPVTDFTSGFAVEPLVKLKLTDTDASGSLLGIRF